MSSSKKSKPLSNAEEKELNQLRKNIALLISNAGYPTIEKFCYENNLPKATVNEIINGNRSPKYISLMRIKNALGVSMHELIGK